MDITKVGPIVPLGPNNTKDSVQAGSSENAGERLEPRAFASGSALQFGNKRSVIKVRE